MATGGSIQSVTLNGREYSTAADNEATVFPGGFTHEQRPNGDGGGRDIKTRTSWKISGIELAIDWSEGDMEFLQDLSNGPLFAVTMTLADDTVLKATGQIEGEWTGSTQSSTVSVDLSGPGTITQ
jgi:hypothetical protein